MRSLRGTIAVYPLCLPSVVGEDIIDLSCPRRRHGKEAGVVEKRPRGVGDERCGGEMICFDLDHGFLSCCAWVLIYYCGCSNTRR